MSEEPTQKPVSRLAQLPPNVLGAAWIIAASLAFASQALVVKTLGQRLDLFQVAFFRCLFGLITLIPFLYGTKNFFLTGRIGTHILRAAVGVGGTFCTFYAVIHLPLAVATAISFTRPLFLVVLAVLFLGEFIRWSRVTATVVGFIGVLIVLRPGTAAFDYAMLVALLGAFFTADVVVLVKKLSSTERNITVLFYFGFITTLVSAIPAALVWQNPTGQELALLILIGVLSSAAQYATIKALRTGEATAVIPFDYSRLIFAAMFGYLFFAEIPDLWTLLGVVILIGSTFYIAQREMREGKAPSIG